MQNKGSSSSTEPQFSLEVPYLFGRLPRYGEKYDLVNKPEGVRDLELQLDESSWHLYDSKGRKTLLPTDKMDSWVTPDVQRNMT